MPAMKATRVLRDQPNGASLNIIAMLGRRVAVLQQQGQWTQVRLIDHPNQAEGWVTTDAVDMAGGGAPSGPIDKLVFAKECWQQGLYYGSNAHYMLAVAELRSRIAAGANGNEIGPYRLLQAEWDHYRQNNEFGLNYLSTDIDQWDMQCSVFGLMARTTMDALPLGGARPSATQLYLGQVIGPAAAKIAINDSTQTISAILGAVPVGELPAGGLTPGQITQRYGSLLSANGSATAAVALKNIADALQTVLDGTHSLALQAGIELLASSATPSQPGSASQGKVDLGSITPEARRKIADLIVEKFAAAGFGAIQQATAVANAIAESNLNPEAHNTAGEDSVGLFQLNRDGGLGTGHSVAELKVPETNIAIIIAEAKKFSAFGNATSLADAVSVFVRKVERPAAPTQEIARRMKIALTLVA